MQVIRAVIGGVFLFLGRELNFFFAAVMAAYLALRITPLLPVQWPAWTHYVFIGGIALLAAAITIVKKRAGYALSGFLIGASVLLEYYEPGVLTLPLLPFLFGGVAGALIFGFFTEWALMIVSCLVGAYALTNSFVLAPNARLLLGAGLFIIGAVTQAIIRHMQQLAGDDEV
jgi:hypothetical protein